MRAIAAVAALALAPALAGCGGTRLLHTTSTDIRVVAAHGGGGLPTLATKNTTRIAGATPVQDAAGVALAVYPSAAPGTHPAAVTLAPSADWRAAIAASVLMAPPIRAPILLSGSGSLPPVTSAALGRLAPTGSGSLDGAKLIRIGDVPTVGGLRSTAVKGSDPFALAAGIDRLLTAVKGRPSRDVVIASAGAPAYAMPAAGWAAESGDPILFVTRSGIPAATRQALKDHPKARVYVLGPPSVIPNSVLAQLRRYGKVKRVGAAGAPANSVAFAAYRDPPCPYGQPCAHVPGSFGWAMRSPGHGYVLINASSPLDAAAAAPLSGSGDYGPQLLVRKPSTLPAKVLNFFLDYATPGYTEAGPTAAVYNHGWVIGDPGRISVSVQSEVDRLLEAVPQSSAR